MELNDRHKISILRVLRESQMPVGSGKIARDIEAYGVELNPRTIRGYLERLEELGLVTAASRGRGGGRMITERGIEEIENASVLDRVGLTAVKVDSLAWRTQFNHRTREGQIVLNLSTIESRHLPAAVRCMLPVFEAQARQHPRYWDYEAVRLFVPDEDLWENIPDHWTPQMWACLESKGIPFHWRCYRCGDTTAEPTEVASDACVGGITIRATGYYCADCGAELSCGYCGKIVDPDEAWWDYDDKLIRLYNEGFCPNCSQRR